MAKGTTSKGKSKKKSSLKGEEKLSSPSSEPVSSSTSSPVDVTTYNPEKDVVETFDKKLDLEWGWGYQHYDNRMISKFWPAVKMATQSKTDFKMTITWFTQDTEGRLPDETVRNYLIFWGWGFYIEEIKRWFKTNFPDFPIGQKEFPSSSDLGSASWQDMPIKDRISVDGPEAIVLPKNAPRR